MKHIYYGCRYSTKTSASELWRKTSFQPKISGTLYHSSLQFFFILLSVLAYAICLLWVETVCLKIVDALSIQNCDKESRLFIQATEIYSYCQDDTYKSSHVKFNGQVQYYQHFYHITQLFPSASQMDPIIYVDHVTILIGNLF